MKDDDLFVTIKNNDIYYKKLKDFIFYREMDIEEFNNKVKNQLLRYKKTEDQEIKLVTGIDGELYITMDTKSSLRQFIDNEYSNLNIKRNKSEIKIKILNYYIKNKENINIDDVKKFFKK